MKKVIKTMMMMLVASAFVLTSCKDSEDPENVVLTINPSKTSGIHFVYDTLNIVINGKGNSDNKLKTLTITKAPEGKPTVTVANEKLSGTDKIYNLKDTFELSEVGKITYTIKLEGEEGTAQTITYVATVMATDPIEAYPTNLSVRGQTQTQDDHFIGVSGAPTLFGTDLTKEEWETEVDIAYYYGTTNKHTICSPKNNTMQTSIYSGLSSFFANSRGTQFYKLAATDAGLYATLENEDDDRKLITFAEGKTFTDAITNLVNGDVILTKNQDGALGLLKVYSLTGTAASEAEMQFRVIYQVK